MEAGKSCKTVLTTARRMRTMPSGARTAVDRSYLGKIDLEAIGRIAVPSSDGVQVPLAQLASIEYVPGPLKVKSEDAFLVL